MPPTRARAKPRVDRIDHVSRLRLVGSIVVSHSCAHSSLRDPVALDLQPLAAELLDHRGNFVPVLDRPLVVLVPQRQRLDQTRCSTSPRCPARAWSRSDARHPPARNSPTAKRTEDRRSVVSRNEIGIDVPPRRRRAVPRRQGRGVSDRLQGHRLRLVRVHRQAAVVAAPEVLGVQRQLGTPIANASGRRDHAQTG
jgi:hypothetical protein